MEPQHQQSWAGRRPFPPGFQRRCAGPSQIHRRSARRYRSSFQRRRPGEAAVEPPAAAAPGKAPEAEGDGRAELAPVEAVDASVDQARVDQGAPPQGSLEVIRKPVAEQVSASPEAPINP